MFPRLVSALILTAFFAPAQQAEKTIPRSEIEGVIRSYLLAHPEILIEMSQALQRKQAEAKRTQAAHGLEANRAALLSSAASPSSGSPANAKGAVTVVEFFDYHCGYCKRMTPAIQKLLSDDPALRFVYKEFPILGEESSAAAVAALAANRQGAYVKFHNLLMAASDITAPALDKLAADAGLDLARFQKDREDPALQEEINRNRALAEALGIDATPAFVVGNEVVTGAMSEETFKGLIAKARAAQATPSAPSPAAK